MNKRNKHGLWRVFFILAAFHLSLIAVEAQEVRRGDCTPDVNLSGEALARGARPMRLPNINKTWDPEREYRQAVILMSFSDVDFKSENPCEQYDSIFNGKGYNERKGPGSVADYFREQSGGLFNLKYDIYGPIKISAKAQPYENPTESTRNYGKSYLREATRLLIDSLDVDFSVYDWDGNGHVEQVIFVYAGLTGNQSVDICYGHIWPNTGSFSTVNTPNGLSISSYTASAELWYNGMSCGIGTICHEFSHSLGLPDIYPTTSGAGFSVVDEWDLMDGGNFTNYGWCPPNYTPMEKMLLGWMEFTELTEATYVENLKTVAEGGEVYRIKHSDSEWLLLENRQQRGWDLGLPGKGLVVYHVFYDKSIWSNNSVNNDRKKRRFELVHADNMDYDAWEKYISTWAKPKGHANSGLMNSYYLSTSPYPWTTDSTEFVNDSLTNYSVPAAKMNYPNYDGNIMLSKPVTNIVQNDDGTVSFDFMIPKCATPTITYENGRLLFGCETEGATFVSKVTTDDVQESEDASIALTTQYTVTVYAVAEGHRDSDTVTATITWGDGVMKVDNITVTATNDKKGDVNQDGVVDVADIANVIYIMASDGGNNE